MIQVQNEIPTEYTALFAEYVAALKKKCSHIMWVVKERGHKTMMIPKEQHVEMVQRLLLSGDERRVRVAEEVMKRSIGTWRER
jgi:hypothetical protein